MYTNLVLIFFLDDLSVVLVGSIQDNRQSSKNNISTKCCTHTVVPPDDGRRYHRNL